MQTTRNIDKTARTAREMAEVQRDSYEALAENLAAAQRRTIGLAEDGLKFMRLQEQSARAAQEWFAGGVRLLQLQQRNAEFVQGWTGNAVDAVARADRAQRAHRRGLRAEREQAAGGFEDAHPGLGGDLQGLFLPLRVLSGGREDEPAGCPAGTSGHRAGSRGRGSESLRRRPSRPIR